MHRQVCITGHTFSPGNAAILWTYAMARSYPRGNWVPETLVERLQLRLRGPKTPLLIGINAENGRCFFYHSSQLEYSHEELQKKLTELLGATSCRAGDCAPRNEMPPLNTNGEPFPPAFVQEVTTRFGQEENARAHSRYWATVQEAEYIFESPFESSFLTADNAVVLHGDALCPRVVYYNVCGTRRPEVFNTETCRRYNPINFYGRRYSPLLSVHMKASAIRHGCINSHIWLTTQRVARNGVKLRTGVKPLMICVERMFFLVNVAMTDNPVYLQSQAFSCTLHGQSDDDILTVSY